MKFLFNPLPSRNLRALAALLLLATSPSSGFAAGDADDFYEMKIGGDKLLSILESLPYATEGQGPVMYVFEYSECPYCQAMYRDFNGKDVGIEFRRMFVPISQRTSAETAALGKSRDIADYHAFMEGRKRAPAFDRDNEAIKAYNAIITAGTKTIPPILKQNGWPLAGFAFPQYFWVENGKVFANAGYTKASFDRAIQRAKEGAPAQMSSTSSAKKAAPLASGTAPSIDYRDFDVVGIHLEMAKDEALRKLREHGPDFDIKETEGNPGAGAGVAGMRYTNAITASKVTVTTQPKMTRSADEIEVYMFAPPNPTTVGAIWRRMVFGEPVLFKELQSSLHDKYGKPVMEGKDRKRGYVLSWTYDNEGRPVTKVPDGGVYYNMRQGPAARG
ncbi:MAG: hypothetical protein PVF51_14360, partial [Nitrospirota bacterium]